MKKAFDIHVMLRAPDDDTAVREALNALAEEGFLEADLDQIGNADRCAQRRAACLRLPGARSAAKWQSSSSAERGCHGKTG